MRQTFCIPYLDIRRSRPCFPDREKRLKLAGIRLHGKFSVILEHPLFGKLTSVMLDMRLRANGDRHGRCIPVPHYGHPRADRSGRSVYKRERMITSPQGGEITVGDRRVINLCANNYLGLADHPALIDAAKSAMEPKGFGMASVRFICGTQDIHRELGTETCASS